MRTPRPSNGCERVAGAARGHARRAGTQLGGDVGTASTTLARRLGTGWQVADLGTTTARLANSITAVDLSSLVLLDVAFAVTVAAIGVALFLLSGLAERRREFATLIAIGAEPRQVRSSMAGETLFIGVAGLATGLVIGGVVGLRAAPDPVGRLRSPGRRSCDPAGARVVAAHERTAGGDRRLDSLEFREAGAIGVAQVFALLPGISRSGITMVTGLARGLDHEDAGRFSFLLATPIIFAAGIYKLPDLLGSNGDGVRPQILVGSIAAGIAAYLSVRFLTRWFATRTLLSFAVYSLIVGVIAIVRFV